MYGRYWIGRALRVEKIHTTPGSVVGTGGRVRYDAGDCEIAVDWYERDETDHERRTLFFLRTTQEGQTYTFNSTELRLISNPFGQCANAGIHLDMIRIPPVGEVPLGTVQRNSSRLAGLQRPNYRGVTYRVQNVRAETPHQMWEISAASERVILDHCV